MAFSVNSGEGSGSGFSKSRFRGTTAISEINIVPFVDILLVLLVIFMLTAHVMEFGMEVDVPQVKRSVETAQTLPVITVARTGETYLNDKPVNINLIGAEVHKRFPKATDVYLRADSQLVWQSLAQVVSELSDAKVKVRLVTKPVDRAGRKR
jgi:biopolymer transport protein ExbD